MSVRKNRQHFEAMKRIDPDYKGFRGYKNEPNRAGNSPLEAIICSICGRKRNVPRGVAMESGCDYVCIRCVEGERAP